MKIEFNGYLEIGLFIFYVFVAFINFLSFIKTLFEEDNSYEKVYEKKEYLKNTIEKYEGRELDEINKRIALLTLYELTSKQYDKGLKLDEKEFRRNQYQNINKGK